MRRPRLLRLLRLLTIVGTAWSVLPRKASHVIASSEGGARTAFIVRTCSIDPEKFGRLRRWQADLAHATEIDYWVTLDVSERCGGVHQRVTWHTSGAPELFNYTSAAIEEGTTRSPVV